MKKLGFVVLCALAFVMSTGPTCAADLSTAKGVVDNIRQPDPPQVSTTTKPSPVGQAASEYHPPAAKSMKSVDTIVVPSPTVTKSTTTVTTSSGTATTNTKK